MVPYNTCIYRTKGTNFGSINKYQNFDTPGIPTDLTIIFPIAHSKMSITFNYFGIPARGEATRVALAYAGKKFIDNRLGFPEYGASKWAGKGLPVLEMDDREYFQSLAMLRYAGKLGGLYPKNPLEALRVDEIVYITEDVMSHLFKTFGAEDDTIAKEVLSGKVDILLKILMSKIDDNPLSSDVNDWDSLVKFFKSKFTPRSSSKFCVGDSLTIADLQVHAMIMTVEAGFLTGIPKTLISDSYASLMDTKAAVMTDPKVSSYYSSL